MLSLVISRISGEGKDRRLEKGDYYLSEREEKDILFLNSRSVPIVLLINAGGPVELTDILEKAQWIKGILNISQLGQEGRHVRCGDPSGEAAPSGKLQQLKANVMAVDVPFAENFSYLNGNREFWKVLNIKKEFMWAICALSIVLVESHFFPFGLVFLYMILRSQLSAVLKLT
ncbi:MAG: hypothetical protein ACLU9T_04160 [Blautia faecis]